MHTQHIPKTQTGTQAAQQGQHISNALIALEITGIFVVALSTSSTATAIGLVLMLIPMVSLYLWLISDLFSGCIKCCKNNNMPIQMEASHKMLALKNKPKEMNPQANHKQTNTIARN